MSSPPGYRTYSVAKGYVQGAYSMMANPHRFQLEDDTSLFMAFHVLCGFAAELYLKAFLEAQGTNDRLLTKADTRHNLPRLLELCSEHGFENDGAILLSQLLGEKHKGFEYRYMKPDATYKTEALTKIFAAFSALDVYVDTAIAASAYKGLKPQGGWSFPQDGEWRLPV